MTVRKRFGGWLGEGGSTCFIAVGQPCVLRAYLKMCKKVGAVK